MPENLQKNRATDVRIMFPAFDHPEYYRDRCRFVAAYLSERHDVEVSYRGITERELAGHDFESYADASIVVPFGVEVAPHIQQLSNVLIHKDASIYENLDNKALMMEFPFVEADSPHVIHQVPSLDMTRATSSEARQFEEGHGAKMSLLKPLDGVSSSGMIKTDALASYCGLAYVAQPYFETHDVISFNFLSISGELIDSITSFYENGIATDRYLSENFAKILGADAPFVSKIERFVREFCAKHKIDGLMEIEFLIADNKPFLLEVNPRISGCIKNVDSRGTGMYLEKLLVPYLNECGAQLKANLEFELFENDSLLMLTLGQNERIWTTRFAEERDLAQFVIPE